MRVYLGIILFIATMLVVARFQTMQTTLTRNLSSLNALYTITGIIDGSEVVNDLSIESERDCNLAWLLVSLSDANQNSDVRERAILRSLNCRPENVTLLWRKFPERTDLAKLATETWPKSAEAWFWLGQSLTYQPAGQTLPIVEAKRKEIIDYYENGLELSAINSVLWREFGDLLEPIDPVKAINAYYMSCLTGDKGSNGCYRAGLTSERLGDIPHAIYYYRLSDWSGAHEHAERLESQVKENPVP